MNRSVDPEENAALAVLAELGRTPGDENTRVTSAEDEVEDVLRRLHLEAMGLMAYALEPVAPSAEARARMLERLSGDSTQEVPRLGDAPPAPAPASPVALTAPPVVAESARPADVAPWPPAAAVVPFPEHAAARRPRPSRWPWSLAALFALAAAGLGYWAAYLQSELGTSQARVARLEAEAERLEGERGAELAALRAELGELERRHAFASAPAVTVFALRPPVDSTKPYARGTLWVASDRRRWQLEVRGLDAEPADRDYQLWFIVDGVPQSGGVFDGRGADTATLADAQIPEGTSVVAITLEPKGGVPAPTTPILLAADRSVTL